MKAVQILPLAPSELAEMSSILMAAALPADDLVEPDRVFFRFRDEAGRTVGFGGLEMHGPSALLRSIVVMPEDRGNGRGRAIVEYLVQQAREAGATRAFLLTTSAQKFFKAQGFIIVRRDDVPAEILSTRQASGLCPATAHILAKALTQ